VRARFDDLEDFFKENYSLGRQNANLVRIRKTLRLLDKGFGARAHVISSRAIAVTAYLFAEEHLMGKPSQVKRFAEFKVTLLAVIQEDLSRLTRYESPMNRLVLDDFQKHVTQASVEPSAIRRRARIHSEKLLITTAKPTGRSLDLDTFDLQIRALREPSKIDNRMAGRRGCVAALSYLDAERGMPREAPVRAIWWIIPRWLPRPFIFYNSP
jgi:hypothetical protein